MLPPRSLVRLSLPIFALTGLLACDAPAPPGSPEEVASIWSEAELGLLTSLSLSAAGPPPPSPGNRVADDPRAAELGHALFFDPALSVNGEVACATCHHPGRAFTDGLALSEGVGRAGANAPTLIGVAHATWFFWDGRRDSLWAQALAPLEAGVEMGTTRVDAVRYVTKSEKTRARYEALFGRPAPFDDASRFPRGAGPFADRAGRDAWNRMHPADRAAVDRAFANLGKLFEAYQRKLEPGPARFDRYVSGLLGEAEEGGADASLTDQEIEGLRLFIDAERTQCLRCHNGPLLTNQSFHHVGTATAADGSPAYGRFLGIQAVLVDPFNCLGPYSDADPEDCGALRFLDRSQVAHAEGQFKTPTLRSLPLTGPYMHDGRFETLEAVMEHYRHPPDRALEPHELIPPLEVSDEEAAAIVAFLHTLDGGVAADPRWLRPPGSQVATTRH